MMANDQQTHGRGDLVMWYTYYADGVISDAGSGIIVAVDDVHSDMWWYKVYKSKLFEFEWIVGEDIERLAQSPIIK